MIHRALRNLGIHELILSPFGFNLLTYQGLLCASHLVTRCGCGEFEMFVADLGPTRESGRESQYQPPSNPVRTHMTLALRTRTATTYLNPFSKSEWRQHQHRRHYYRSVKGPESSFIIKPSIVMANTCLYCR